MRAVVYDAVGAAPEVREVAEPSCPDAGVVVAVAASGVCRSDWHAWRGHDPVRLPHIGGHELAGTIVARLAGVDTSTLNLLALIIQVGLAGSSVVLVVATARLDPSDPP